MVNIMSQLRLHTTASPQPGPPLPWFPVIKSLDQFDFRTLPSLNKAMVLDLAQGGYLDKRENLILMGNSGTGKTHLATALGLIACQIFEYFIE